MSEKPGALSVSFRARPRFVVWGADDGTWYGHFIGEWPQEIDREGGERFLELIANATELADSGLLGEPQLAAWFVADRIAKALVGDEAIELSLFGDE